MAMALALLGGQVWALEPRPILEYIRQTWTTLTRSNKNLATAAVDPKFKPGRDGRWPVYVPQNGDAKQIEAALKSQMTAADFATINIQRLPVHLGELRTQGLLYLPFPYVVPGGRFNEMYGWDSYFIELGLLHDGEIKLAQDMVDNFLYQVENYGKVLNANRTYYLTRSQPPFLTEMVLGVYAKTHDRQWLAGALPDIREILFVLDERPALDARDRTLPLFRFGGRTGSRGGIGGERCGGAHAL